MASSSSSHQQDVEQHGFSAVEPHIQRRKVCESTRLYDVFINHRGPDVKHTLARQFYNSLQQLEIRAFLDCEEKQVGDSFPSTIESAIRSASIHIAIFSKRYAESPWCLAELVLMLKSKAMIIPVFYDVQPWELRHIEKGAYADAFVNYQNKSRHLDKLQEWKEALRSVSLITGLEFSKHDNDNNNLCESIVSTVKKEVEKKASLYVAKHSVGLEELVEDFESFCSLKGEGKDKASVVGIFGMGGIGKTTLAKELFNRKRPEYKEACFLFDVREASTRNELPSLQSDLLKHLFQEDPPKFRSIDEGTSLLKHRLEGASCLSFLVVLDDIDHLDQLDALLITDKLGNSGNGLVIVTTRDEGVLISADITIRYNLKGMNKNDGAELFCWHALGKRYPPSGYENLVSSFVDLCGGSPLALQVLGRHVYERTQSYWELQLGKVHKTLPGDIKKRLKISFDSLDNEEQQIFLVLHVFFQTERRI